MTTSKIPCPKCRKPLVVPAKSAPGAMVQCHGCGQWAPVQATGIKATPKVPTPVPARTLAEPPAHSSRSYVVLGSIAVLLTGLLGVLVIAVVYGFGGLGNNTANIDYSSDIPSDLGKPVVQTSPEVTRAMNKGIAYVRNRLLKQKIFHGVHDHNIGATALAGLTLLECGLPPDDPAVKKAISVVYKKSSDYLGNTYAVSLAVLFFDRLIRHKKVSARDKPRYQRVLQKLALHLIAAQHASGGWNYICQKLSPQQEKKLLTSLKKDRFQPGASGYPRQGKRHDNSIAQFAVAALWVARNHGIPVAVTLVHEEKRYRDYQNTSSGAWDYNVRPRGSAGRPQMTCSGLFGLAIGHAIYDELPAGKKKTAKNFDLTKKQHIQKALQYIGRALDRYNPEEARMRQYYRELIRQRAEYSQKKNYSAVKVLDRDLDRVKKEARKKGYNMHSGHLDLYFLWSTERVAMIFGLPTIAGRDWYTRGSSVIIDQQRPDGSWRYNHGDPVGTCFALLFLKRSNLVKDLTDKLRNLRAALLPRPQQPAPPRQHRDP